MNNVFIVGVGGIKEQHFCRSANREGEDWEVVNSFGCGCRLKIVCTMAICITNVW
ncbi:MAG: hypothetical protein QM737_21080 [Ferruginibacter sp.]